MLYTLLAFDFVSHLNFTPTPGSCTEPGAVFLGLPHFLSETAPFLHFLCLFCDSLIDDGLREYLKVKFVNEVPVDFDFLLSLAAGLPLRLHQGVNLALFIIRNTFSVCFLSADIAAELDI